MDWTTVTLYKDANTSIDLPCLKLGEISDITQNGSQIDDGMSSCATISGTNIVRSSLDPIHSESLTETPLNEIASFGTSGISLYNSPHLNNGITLFEYNSTYSAYQRLQLFTTGSDIRMDIITFSGFNVNAMYPAIAKINGTLYFGIYTENTLENHAHNGAWAFVCNVELSDVILPDIDYLTPGDEGFQPTNDVNDGKSIGGRGKGSSGGHSKRPDWKTDVITNPDAPDETGASIANSGFLNVYKINRTNLKKLGQCLFGSTLNGFLANMLINPIDYIVSINLFPCQPDTDFSESIKIGRWDCVDNVLDADATGYPLQKQFKVIHFGTLQIGENWGSFLDYTGTTIQLYLPFVGVVDIDVNEVMNGSITVDYTIDFYTGMCVANVLCTKTINTPTKYGTQRYNTVQTYAQHSYQGNCAVQIPITAMSYGGIVGSITGAITNACIGNGGGAVASLVDGVGNIVKPPVTSKGAVSANGGFCSILYPYISITRPVTNIPESYQETVGYMSYVDKSLAGCSGLCVVDSIDLKGVSGATDSELQRIESMCKQGVYV